MLISQWEIDTGSEDFAKRYEKARKIPVIKSDSAEGSYLTGSSGYITSLDSCSCVDFRSRKAPCKHILAVAIFEGLLPKDLDVKREKIVPAVTVPTFWQWETTSDPEQSKRFASACKADCTPLSVDASIPLGVFSGSHGIYNAAPDRCDCVDFAMRRLPCKHIYRLALELGVLSSENVERDPSKVKLPAETRRAMLEATIEKIESYPDELQTGILDVLYMAMYRPKELYLSNDPETFEKAVSDGLLKTVCDYKRIIEANPKKSTVDPLIETGFSFPEEVGKTKKAIYDWCLEHADDVGPLVYPNHLYILPAGDLDIVKKKVYTYLCRKYRDEEYFDADMNPVLVPFGTAEEVVQFPDGRIERRLSFPDDDITELLNKYGANRCRG